MKKRRLFIEAAAVLLGIFLLAGCQQEAGTPPTSSPEVTSSSLVPPTLDPTPDESIISGVVLTSDGQPISGAAVRIQATENSTLTDNRGHFFLTVPTVGEMVTVSAWAEGYYCAKVEQVSAPASGLTISMRSLQTGDNPAYEWVAPTGENSCYSCKAGVTQVWLDNDAHGRSATNLRYLTMYNGTDVYGNQSPLTRYVFNRDYGYFPLKPDMTQPYYGPGYMIDFPGTAGNCAACHNAGAAIDAPYGTNPNTVSGVDTFGIHCDYCHKVVDVTLDPNTGLPYPNMPGVLSQDIRRPFTDDPDRYQLFVGSFDDDNVPMEDTYLPLYQQSQYCAPCHYGIFWDTTIYNSYGEWLDSPYSSQDAALAAGLEAAQTCQQCHMPAPTIFDGQAITNIAPNTGGIERDPLTIRAHTFPGAASLDLLQNSVTMTVQAERTGDLVTVSVTIINDRVGHHVPTDSPLRQMILLVQAAQEDGKSLDFVDGPTVPAWAGIGNPAEGYYGGLPGQGYAKILQEMWTKISPSGAYWNPTRVISDNRLPALGSDTTLYHFEAPAAGPVTIDVRLYYRRAFIELMEQKGWNDPDILMEEQIMELDQDGN